MSATPTLGLHMFGILRVADDFQELLIARNAANIFGWSGTGAIKASRLLGGDIKGKQFLKLDRMMPVVAKIVEVRERRSRAHEIPQADFAFIEDPRIIREGTLLKNCDIAVTQAADVELMEMIVPPVEGRLDRQM